MFWLTVLEPRVLVDGLGAVAAVVCRYCAAHLDLLDVAIGSRACVRAGSRAVLADAPTMLRAEVGAQPLGLDGLLELEVERPDAVRVSPSFSTLLVPASLSITSFSFAVANCRP